MWLGRDSMLRGWRLGSWWRDIGLAEVGSAQIGVSKIGTCQDTSGEADAGEGRLAQVDPEKLKTGKIVVFEVGPRTAAQVGHEPRVPLEDANQFV